MTADDLRAVRAAMERQLKTVIAVESAMSAIEAAGVSCELVEEPDRYALVIPVDPGPAIFLRHAHVEPDRAPEPGMFWPETLAATAEPAAEPEPEPELKPAAEPGSEPEAAPIAPEPEPAPEPEGGPDQPLAAEPRAEAAPVIPEPDCAKNRNGMPWTAGEDQRLLGYAEAGFPVAEMQRVTGRSKSAINSRLSVLRNRKPEPEPNGRWFRTPDPSEPGSVKAVCHRLNTVGYPPPWTPDKDLTLTEALLNAAGAVAAAARVGVSREEAVARFRLLCPEPGYEAQELLCKELRRRI